MRGEGAKIVAVHPQGGGVLVVLAMAVGTTVELPPHLGDILASPGYLDPTIFVYTMRSWRKQAIL